MTWIFQAILCKAESVSSFLFFFSLSLFSSSFSFSLFLFPSFLYPLRQQSNSHLWQEHTLKSTFLWQSVLVAEWLWVTVTAQQNLHHKAPKLHVSRRATAFVVLQTSSPLTIIISILFSVPCRSFNMKQEGLHGNKLFKKYVSNVWSSLLRNVEKPSFKIKNETTEVHLCIDPLMGVIR